MEVLSGILLQVVRAGLELRVLPTNLGTNLCPLFTTHLRALQAS